MYPISLLCVTTLCDPKEDFQLQFSPVFWPDFDPNPNYLLQSDSEDCFPQSTLNSLEPTYNEASKANPPFYL